MTRSASSGRAGTIATALFDAFRQRRRRREASSPSPSEFASDARRFTSCCGRSTSRGVSSTVFERAFALPSRATEPWQGGHGERTGRARNSRATLSIRTWPCPPRLACAMSTADGTVGRAGLPQEQRGWPPHTARLARVRGIRPARPAGPAGLSFRVVGARGSCTHVEQGATKRSGSGDASGRRFPTRRSAFLRRLAGDGRRIMLSR